MCLLSFAWHANPDIPFAIAANRDEFLARPTQPMHFWEPDQQILAGKDLEAGGTWMAFNRMGKFAALTNIRHPEYFGRSAPSRGALIIDFMQSNKSISHWAEQLLERCHIYNGFNLVFGNQHQLLLLTSQDRGLRALEPGVYSLSNGHPDDYWPKMKLAGHQMTNWLDKPDFNLLHSLHSSTETRELAELPETGVSSEIEVRLSAQCVQFDGYATRGQTGALVNKEGELKITESQLYPDQLIQSFTIPDFWKSVATDAH